MTDRRAWVRCTPEETARCEAFVWSYWRLTLGVVDGGERLTEYDEHDDAGHPTGRAFRRIGGEWFVAGDRYLNPSELVKTWWRDSEAEPPPNDAAAWDRDAYWASKKHWVIRRGMKGVVVG